MIHACGTALVLAHRVNKRGLVSIAVGCITRLGVRCQVTTRVVMLRSGVSCASGGLGGSERTGQVLLADESMLVLRHTWIGSAVLASRWPGSAPELSQVS